MEPELTTRAVLKRDIPWETYMTAKLITGTGLQLLRRYDHKPENVQAALLDENGVAYVKVFVGILRDISKEDTLEYIVAVIDDMLSANPKRARLFHEKFLESIDIYDPFLRLLLKRKWFIQETTCKILTLIISARPSDEFQESEDNTGKQPISDLDKTLRALVDWLCGQLKHPAHPTRAVATAVSSLATILREKKVREILLKSGGVKLLANLISPPSAQQHIQLLYEAILCVWLLTYYDPVFEAFTEAQVVPRLVEIVKVSTKEKVTRIALLSLRNLVTKGSFISELVKLGFLKIIQNTRLQQTWADEDLKEALDVLEFAVEENLKDLNSFETYKEEVSSGFLDWTAVHKDPVFWNENYKKFEEDDFQVLRNLISMLENSRDPRTLAVACQDIYRFIGSHPTGRGIISSLNAKQWVMRLMAHDSPEVAREALLCVQRILLSPKYADRIEFLEGCWSIDDHFRSAPLEENLPAILPYCQALQKLAPHIQQVNMESNGKGVSIDGHPLPYRTGEIDFGEPGTNGQHSFYQLIHQGRIVPCEFIGIIKSQQSVYLKGEQVSNHDELMCNFFAQADALAYGKTRAECEAEKIAEEHIPHKMFTGNRPSLSILVPNLTPYTTGQSLAGKVRSQMNAARTKTKPLYGFNYSTTTLLTRYLQGKTQLLYPEPHDVFPSNVLPGHEK